MTETTRLESDSIGTMQVPEDAYYGVQSLRAQQNFPITGTKMNPVFIQNLATIKKAAALTNYQAGRLSREVADAIVEACEEVCAGQFEDQFIVDAIQGGAGTSANMNMNEVIATGQMSCSAASVVLTTMCIRTIMSICHSRPTM